MEMFECSRCVLVSGKGKYASKLAGPTISSRWIEGANTLLALFAERSRVSTPPTTTQIFPPAGRRGKNPSTEKKREGEASGKK
jgi:hypothetical protein